MTDQPQKPGRTGNPGIIGLLGHAVHIGQIAAAWRQLAIDLTTDTGTAASVEDKLWAIPDPTESDGSAPSPEEQAVAIIEAALGSDVEAVAFFAHSAAETLIESGDLPAAARLLATAARMYKAAGNADAADVSAKNAADTWRALGQRLFRAGDFAAAHQPLETALRAYRALPGRDRIEHTAETSFDLAITCTKLKGIEGSVIDGYFDLAAILYEHFLPAGNQQRVDVLLAYAEYELATNQRHYAIRHFSKALITLRKRAVRDEAAEAELVSRLQALRAIAS